MNYEEITFKDSNIIKRYLQRMRLITAIQSSIKYINSMENMSICDFGAGNGELVKYIVKNYKNPLITCYEPTTKIYREAKKNLLNYNAKITHKVDDLPVNSYDVIFCLEVFEHLPPNKTKQTFDLFKRLLKKEGLIIIGIPIEIGIQALYKGLFRMNRRYGSFDANIKNVIKSIFMNPPIDRPIINISPGFPYYSHHLGFDYRVFLKECKNNFKIIDKSASPYNLFGLCLMPEMNLILQKYTH